MQQQVAALRSEKESAIHEVLMPPKKHIHHALLLSCNHTPLTSRLGHLCKYCCATLHDDGVL